jgi:hypothetical protein
VPVTSDSIRCWGMRFSIHGDCVPAGSAEFRSQR